VRERHSLTHTINQFDGYRKRGRTEAVSLALPLRRRFWSTLRPALVWLRLRNPNFLARRSFDGL